MVFNSLTFAVFFVIVVGVYYLPLPWRAKKLHLLIASYIFYGAWNPPFVALLWASTVLDWITARCIYTARTQGQRRFWLALSLLGNLGSLSFFKYGQFALENFQALMASRCRRSSILPCSSPSSRSWSRVPSSGPESSSRNSRGRAPRRASSFSGGWC